MKQKILILMAALSFAAVLNAQEAKMYIMKNGTVINYPASGQGIAVADIDSIIFYNPFDVNISWCNLQWPESLTASPGATSGNAGGVMTSEIYGRLLYAGITDQPAPSSSVQAQLGIGIGNPLTNAVTWTYVNASFYTQVGNTHEYKAPFIAPLSPGTYRYVYRFRVNAGNWTYGGGLGGTIDGNFDPNTCGTLIVTNY